MLLDGLWGGNFGVTEGVGVSHITFKCSTMQFSSAVECKSAKMRASPRISLLGEGGDPCIAGNGPLNDHKTAIFPGDVFLFH